MAFSDLPDCLQAAYARRQRTSAKHFWQNNYLAEARPVLGGRNAKGAGAPRGNRNAAGSRLLRQHIRLKRRNDQQRYHLLVLAAAIAHWEGRGKAHFSPNNYLAENGLPYPACFEGLRPGQLGTAFGGLRADHLSMAREEERGATRHLESPPPSPHIQCAV